MVQLKKKITIKTKHAEESSISSSFENKNDAEEYVAKNNGGKLKNVCLWIVSILIFAVIVFLSFRDATRRFPKI